MTGHPKETQVERLRRFGIDAGQTDAGALPILFADLELSDLDLMTIRDLVRCDPEPADEGLIGMLGLMFSVLVQGSLCLVLDMAHLQETILPTADAAVAELVSGFMARLDQGCYDALIDRTGGDVFKPMVLDETTGRRLLYFQKFHFHERRLNQRLKSHLAVTVDHHVPEETQQAVIDELYRQGAAIRKGVDGNPIVRDPFQVKAIRAALTVSLLIVSGGPGTGKTSLLVNILRALVRTGTDPSRIVLAAPTGRAAQRMSEALMANLATIVDPDDSDLRLMNLRGSTLHRLLVYRSRRGKWLYGGPGAMPADVIAVDEVSMVDVAMMDRLFQAIEPGRTRVILMGDKDQLPSVEAGSVLADLCPAAGSAFARHFVELHNVYRSAGELLALAQAIKEGHPVSPKPMDFDRALAMAAWQWAFVETGDGEAMNRHIDRWLMHQYLDGEEKDAGSYVALVRRMNRLMEGPESLFIDGGMELLNRIFTFVNQCRILTVVRRGITGSRGVNERIAAGLRKTLDPEADPANLLFNGALIMITRNDYTRDLFNGDVGVAIRHTDGFYRVYFKRARGMAAFQASGLIDWDLAFAMTVHKSQGSEFDDTLLMLPEDKNHRLLTREIIYTAATRASRRLIVCGTIAAFQSALQRKIVRQSGLII